MKPAAGRRRVEYLVQRFGVSTTRACGLVKLGRSTWYWRSKAKDTTALRMRLREVAEARRRFGYRRLHTMLRREGWTVNQKRVYRLYRMEGLGVRTKKRKKRASHLRVILPAPTSPNERWSMDFMRDTLDDGRPFRILTVVDTFTRECPLLAADFSLTGTRVADLLDVLASQRGYPKAITVDNGTRRRWTRGPTAAACSCNSSGRVSPSRTRSSRASTVACGTSC
ncbi:hypothetical protein AMYX_31710 [Anaeromyxobacter diazotrophicus]|uniref:Integrase catalytic domain-containing protein n=1 Tax=Anaeromyxobacter diazotrophicus TaxID=2590199 RepID=A0A7I9VQM9_9BACT|nr:hypothetical protein AMYX_31710 [Anaeromyxobacter diazotrophicus]